MQVIPHIFGKPIGILSDDRGGILFEYFPDFVEAGLEISPFVLPLLKNRIYSGMEFMFFNQLPTVFHDSLPDSFGSTLMRNYFYNKYGNLNKYNNYLNKLLYMSDRGIGAIKYEPMMEIDKREVIELKKYIEQSKRILKGEASAVVSDLTAHPSPGGARPKAFVDWDRDKNIMSVGAPTNNRSEKWIVKFHEDNGIETTKLEYIYFQIAKDYGLDIPDFDLIPDCEDENINHFAIKRFDFTENRDFLHQHTLCGLLAKRHNERGLAGYGDFLHVTQELTADIGQVKRGFKQMIFNIVGRNCDDHTKNFSFLMDKEGKWTLSPAYDLLYSYGDDIYREHFLHINGKIKDITFQDILKIGEKFSLSEQYIKDEIENCMECFTQFGRYSLNINFPKKIEKEIAESIFSQKNNKIFPKTLFVTKEKETNSQCDRKSLHRKP